jgi:hypothetical protein
MLCYCAQRLFGYSSAEPLPTREIGSDTRQFLTQVMLQKTRNCAHDLIYFSPRQQWLQFQNGIDSLSDREIIKPDFVDTKTRRYHTERVYCCPSRLLSGPDLVQRFRR